MKNVLAAFARNRVFANILLFLIFLAGAMAMKNMIRETFPEFSLDMIAVTVFYPGADPEEVEEGISRKIEEAIEGLEGIKQYTTKSSEGMATAQIEVKENFKVSDVLDRVRSKIDGISNLPVDAEKPITTEIILKDSVALIALSGDMPEERLKEWARQVEDEIQQIPEISQVGQFGTREYEIGIEVSETRLREYGLTFDQVVNAVRNSNLNLAGGTIRSQGEEIRVRTVGRKYTGQELAGIVVLARPQGEIITLDRLAHIDDGFAQDPVSVTVNGRPAVMLHVFKTKGEDSLTISQAVHKFVAEKKMQMPGGADIRVIFDTTDMLRDRINLLVRNGIMGLILVFVLLWLFLDFKLSFWVGMGIPISLCGGLVILWIMGETINMISLFGMIMVLGIVVDDAIVVGEAIFVHRQRGKKPLRAAVDGVGEVGLPVIAAAATTVGAFLPLAYIGGIMGKFIAILPIVVICCLLISLLECMFLLPAHLNDLPDRNGRKQHRPFLWRISGIHRLTGQGLEWFVERIYAPFLRKALRWRYVSLCTAIAFLLITIGFVKGGLLKFQVFSELDGFIITANVEFPNGTPPDVTRRAVEQLDAALMRLNGRLKTLSGEPMVANRMTIAGRSLDEHMIEEGPHLGGMYAIFIPSERRGIHSKDIEVLWEKEVPSIPGIKSLTFQGMAAGPPGAPIEVWIQGHQMDAILAAANDLKDRLARFDGVYQIRSDFAPGKNELRLELRPEARALGLTVSDLARQVYAGYYGEEAVRLQRGQDDIRVKVRYTADERSQIAGFDQIRIRTPQGHEVPLLSAATVSFAPGYSTITRTDGMRRVAVSASVDNNKANANEILADLSSGYFSELTRKYPGLYIALQGEQKKVRESFSSLYVGFPLALLGNFIIIAAMFRSYVQTFVIMVTVPFGIIGAMLGHMVMGYDLSLLSVFGIVALTGVVVNDAIVLIERINENLADGMPFLEAIQNGGARRFRAIILTTVTTVGGLAPLILETDMQARFLIPMALSLASGVAFATLLTLVLIPNLLVILNDLRRTVRWIMTGQWPEREEVEPAAARREGMLEDNDVAAETLSRSEMLNT
jgi:multidrug efflux pump subunit AcrB